MKYVFFLVIFPICSFAETLSVALYENHDEYINYSNAYKLNWQFFKLAAESEGITLKAEEHLWIRAMHFLEEKKIDAVIGVYYTNARSEYGYFSQPMAVDNVYLFSKDTAPLSIAKLSKQSVLVGATTESIGESIAKEKGFTNIYVKTSSYQVFDLLMKNKLDYAIFAESVATKHCQSKRRKSCITPIQPPLIISAFHTLYSKTPQLKRIAKKLDSAIEKLIDNGKAKQLFLELNYSEQEYQKWIEIRDNWIASTVSE